MQFPPIQVPGNGELRARITTTLGTIEVHLFEHDVPNTVANFVGLATGAIPWKDPKTGQEVTGRSLYAGTTFHRVIPNFMIQGGCPRGDGTGSPGYRFADEINPKFKHDRPGRLSMANSGPNTNGSQFFITEVPTPWLDGKHAIFGEVVQGMDTLQKVVAAPRGPGDKPKTPIVVQEIQIFRAG
ncbi:MAG: peptidylprolyl isomerase [Deltaproteobacteria bacterium]|nr:peptidylprolyl isomerase [Deltaproteobacteria bacterium]